MIPRWLVAFLGPLAAMAAMICASASVVVAVGGDWRSAASTAAFAIAITGLAIGSVRYGSDKVIPRIGVDSRGTTIRPTLVLDVALAVVFTGDVLVALATLLQWSWSVVTRPVTVPHVLYLGLSIVFILLIPMYCRWLGGYLRWGASRCLRVSPDGVEVGQFGRRRSYRWDQIRSVTCTSGTGSNGLLGSIALAVADDEPVHLPTTTFLPDPSALRDFVDFYWRYPDARSELTDGTAPDRLGHMLVRR